MASKDAIKIEIPGLTKLTKGLAVLAELEEAKEAVDVGANHLKATLQDYPPRRYVSIQEAGGWASDKQRRFVIMAIRVGIIEFPYRRGQSESSEDLADAWTIKREAKGLGARIGNDTSYGPFVQDAKEQSSMMEIIGWKTTEQVADEESDTVIEGILAAIDRALDRL